MHLADTVSTAMEMMPSYAAPDPDPAPDLLSGQPPVWESLPTWGPVARSDWRASLPVLEALGLTLRELRLTDAPSLFAQLTTEEVARFISPPPASVAGFEDFIRWAHRRRADGRYACFAVVPAGETAAVGMFQIKVLDADAGTAEWGFALGSAYWGTGLFLAGAHPVVDFAFAAMGVRRLEARACVANGRGTGALRKVGAVRAAVLPGAFERHGERLDQVLWTISREDWWAAKAVGGGTVH